MPGINGKFRGDGRLRMRHGPLRLRVLPVPPLVVAEKPPDPLATLLARFPVVIQEAAIEVLGPILAEFDGKLEATREALRLERPPARIS